LKQELNDRDLSNIGFLGYPVLQAADVLLYKSEGVPVGKDQVPHLELAREITRRFNNTYKKVFPEPKALLTKSPKIQGIDGRKMSKSFGNAIFLSDSEETVKKKIREMVTDPKRARRQDPGDPDTCNLYPLHALLSSKQTIKDVRKGCTTAGIGCVDCKGMLLPSLLEPLKKIRERRVDLAGSPKKIDSVLRDGTQRARAVAAQTMQEVRDAIRLSNE
jgi:tryptophanyl-tRNA synthetase